MSNLKTRLVKLESASSDTIEPLHIMRIIVGVGNVTPIGYRCGDVEIIREPNEPEEEFKTRCHDAVDWSDGNSRHIFCPIYAGH